MGSCASVHGKKSDSSSPSADKFPMRNFLSSKTNKNSIPPTPVKEKPMSVDGVPQSLLINSVGYKSQVSPFNTSSFSNHGSKDETFFDSQAWLESDCESDFYSVNGDFTPSRGSTPVHGSATPGGLKTFSHQLNNALSEGRLAFNNARPFGSTPLHRASGSEANGSLSGVKSRVSTSSTNSPPSGRRKKLGDFFKESTEEDGNAAVKEMPDVMNQNDADNPPKSSTNTLYHPDTNSVSSVGRTSRKVANSEAKKQPQCCLPRLVSSYTLHERKKPMTLSNVRVAA